MKSKGEIAFVIIFVVMRSGHATRMRIWNRGLFALTAPETED